MARELSKNPTVLIVNDTIFAHGGVMPVSLSRGFSSAWQFSQYSPNLLEVLVLASC